MNFKLSAGTLDSLTGIFSPARATSRGGRPGERSWPFGSGNHVSRSAHAIATLKRTAQRSPEVMVKVTGSQKGGAHVLANFSYISRLGQGDDKQVELFTSEKEVLSSAAEMRELAEHWHDHEMSGDDRRKGATSISMILSMTSGTDPDALREASLAFAAEEMANRYWVAALHIDKDHPHVHLTIARRDHDGVRFHPNKDDLFRYRQIFAQKLRDRGIEANATPARARGVEPTHEPIAVRKLRDKGTILRLDEKRSAMARAIIEKTRPDASLARAAADQSLTKEVYQRSIAELASSSDPEMQAVARSLNSFVGAMPAPATRLSRLAYEIAREGDAPRQVIEGRIVNDAQREVIDPVADVLERAKLARAQRQVDSPAVDTPPATTTPAETSAERMRRMVEEARVRAAAADKAIHNIGNRVERADRDRDLDRSKHKEGPQQ